MCFQGGAYKNVVSVFRAGLTRVVCVFRAGLTRAMCFRGGAYTSDVCVFRAGLTRAVCFQGGAYTSNVFSGRGLHERCVCVFSELRFSVFPPSAVACSCLTAAVIRLDVLKNEFGPDGLLQLLRDVLNTDMVRIHS